MPKFAQMGEIAFWNICNVFAAEDAHLKVFDLTCSFRSLSTGILQILKTLEDDFVGVDILGNFLRCLAMRNEIFDRVRRTDVGAAMVIILGGWFLPAGSARSMPYYSHY